MFTHASRVVSHSCGAWRLLLQWRVQGVCATSVRRQHAAAAIPAAPAPPRAAVTPDAEWCMLRSDISAAPREQGHARPTAAQARVIPALLRGESALIAEPTGTGKTLAYLLPVCHRLKEHEEASHRARRASRPRAVVLVPTRELAEQVTAAAKRIAHTAKLRVMSLLGGSKQSVQVNALSQPVDVVVGTPGRVRLHLQNHDLYLTDVLAVVLDEADTLLDQTGGFLEEVQHILTPLQRRLAPPAASAEPSELPPPQIVLAGASVSGVTRRTAEGMFPGIHWTTGEQLHHVPASVRQQFVRVGGGSGAKHDAVMDVLREVFGAGRHEAGHQRAKGGNQPRVVVFCNSVASARSTAHFLVESGGYSTACLHGDIPPALRARQYRDFLDGTCSVLVATDAAARGLDIPNLQHVILFDFPRNATDYLHRVGRVGRAGATGTAISLVSPRDITFATHIQYLAKHARAVTSPPRRDAAPIQARTVRATAPSFRRLGVRA